MTDDTLMDAGTEDQALHRLADWSHRAAAALAEIVADADAAAGGDGKSECHDIRALLVEHDALVRGRQTSQCALEFDAETQMELDI